MTIRVIYPGFDKYRGKCSECSCEFSYEREDVTRVGMSDAGCVPCPHCNRPVAHHGVESAEPKRWAQ